MTKMARLKDWAISEVTFCEERDLPRLPVVGE